MIKDIENIIEIISDYFYKNKVLEKYNIENVFIRNIYPEHNDKSIRRHIPFSDL